MTLRLLAAAAALSYLSLAAAPGAFLSRAAAADAPGASPPPSSEAPACAAERRLEALEAMLNQTRFKVLRLAAADAADYRAGVQALFGSELPEADLIIVVEVVPESAGDPAEAVEIVLGLKDGCFAYRVEARAALHRKVMEWIDRRRNGITARLRAAPNAGGDA